MSNVVLSDKVAHVLLHGDLKSLSQSELTAYAQNVCDSLGISMLGVKVFDFIVLNGKLTMYATKACTDQLRKVHDVSITKLEKENIDGMYTVTAYAKDKTGKEDSDIGSVDITGLKGEKLANAMMKASTKAKRRVTLSICGLGMLDETEVQDIPRDVKAPVAIEREFKRENLKEPAFSPEVVIEPEEDLGKYVVKFGKKYNGRMLKSLDIFELDQYLTWIKENSAELDRPLIGNALELVEVGEAYLKTKEFNRSRG